MTFRSRVKLLIAAGAIVFLLAAFFGLSHTGMSADMNGQMAGCPFMAAVTVCQMTPLQHILSWQNAFAALPGQNGLSEFFSLFLLAIAALLFARLKPKMETLPEQNLYFSDLKRSPAKRPFLELFSDGILNPKIF